MLYLAVALGGALGACCRYGITQMFSLENGGFPKAIFFANLLGCFIAGLIYVAIVERGSLPLSWREPLIVGFCGALTTYSSFALDALVLWQSGHAQTAIFYVVLTTVFCIVAAFIAVALMRALY